jgi:hypothetical protein
VEEALWAFLERHLKSIYDGDPEGYNNPSCYPSIFWAMRPRLWARTKESTLMTKPSWVTA